MQLDDSLPGVVHCGRDGIKIGIGAGAIRQVVCVDRAKNKTTSTDHEMVQFETLAIRSKFLPNSNVRTKLQPRPPTIMTIMIIKIIIISNEDVN